MSTLRTIRRLLRWGLPTGVIVFVLLRWRQGQVAPAPEPVGVPSSPAPASRTTLADTAPAAPPPRAPASSSAPSAPSTAAPNADAEAPSADADDARAVFGRAVKADDLKVIEGIGPKIAELLEAAGIATWDALASADHDRLKAVLADGGDRFRMHDPSTWPEQASLAARGEWAALKHLQDELKGGRRA
jgi:large subunit ribosomal protein L27